MPDRYRPELGRLVVTPLATIGVLAAVLLWEIEHVGSVLLAVLLAAMAIGVGVLVARAGRKRIEELSEHYETLLQTADEQSRRAEAAMRIKDEFLATLSHELRTPLNSILGWTRLISGGKLTPEQVARALHAIDRAGWAQAHLIDDLLDASHMAAGTLRLTMQPIFAPDIVGAVIEALRPAADAKRIVIEKEMDDRLERFSADPGRLYQVVWNLVSNAIKFTPSGGHVLVKVERDDRDLVLTVRDNGVGFVPSESARLFERFRQGDSSSTRQHGGLGLGLGIVKDLVELHGGTITAHSAGKDRGAEFVVRLPMREAPSEQGPAALPPNQLLPVLSGISVLVVDDDPEVLDVTRACLEQHGAVVAMASSAREAREQFERQPPDVLISDIRMPDEDGIQLIHDIRHSYGARGRATPAAALTALSRAEDRSRALCAGFNMHLVKPVEPLELAAAVARLASHSRTRSASPPQSP